MHWTELITPKFGTVVKTADACRKEDFDKSLTMAFVRNITLQTTGIYAKYFCGMERIHLDVEQLEFDNAMQLTMDGGSELYALEPDVIVVALSPLMLSEDLTGSYASLSAGEIEREEEAVVGAVSTVVSQIRQRCDATILVHNFERPVLPAYGVIDSQDAAGQQQLYARMNARLASLASGMEKARIVDLDRLQGVLGRERLFDHRYWHMAKSPYTRDASRLIAWEYMKYLRPLAGRVRKCLVLDCDNTLWGGIVGEDGLNGIGIGHTFPGSAYADFQRAALDLSRRGVLLAVCSKNNEADVMEVFEKHPDMVLRPEHFVSMHVNWDDKPGNIAAMAKELNIGLDSFVFLDDSGFEVDMVRAVLPEVAAMRLPPAPEHYADLLMSCGMFDTLAISDEDRRRSSLYKAQVDRHRAADQFEGKDLSEYYAYLEMRVAMGRLDDFTVPRVAQLTQRTNQFNLTTIRYSEEDVSAMIGDPDTDVIHLHLADRFGDTGLVGAAVLRFSGREALLDTFLLSCRVIGRKVEDVLLSECMAVARARGCARLIGLYRSTPKNSQVAEFYPARGFEDLDEGKDEGKDERRFALALDKAAPDFPNFFKEIRHVD